MLCPAELGSVDGSLLCNELSDGAALGPLLGINKRLGWTEGPGPEGGDVPSEQPPFRKSTSPTVDDQLPLLSCSATQKNAPPLQGYASFRAVITAAACWASAFDPVLLQSLMQKPNMTFSAAPSNISFTNVW
jgi:hypothetical protein